jgi:hypothetical protein
VYYRPWVAVWWRRPVEHRARAATPSWG